MSPRDMGAAETSATPKLGPLNAFDPAAVLAQQQRIAEALAASGQKFLEGLQEVAHRTALLQTAFLQQALAGLASVGSASPMGLGGPPGRSDDAATQASAVAEATVASLRDVMEAACKCHTEALATFQQHMAGAAAPASCGEPARS